MSPVCSVEVGAVLPAARCLCSAGEVRLVAPVTQEVLRVEESGQAVWRAGALWADRGGEEEKQPSVRAGPWVTHGDTVPAAAPLPSGSGFRALLSLSVTVTSCGGISAPLHFSAGCLAAPLFRGLFV